MQFPNLPLLVAITAGGLGKLVAGSGQSYLLAIAFLAMAVWAYEELLYGVNWFRHALGLTYAVVIVVRALH